MKRYSLSRPYSWLIALVCLAFWVPIFGYAYNGSFMRLSGDDYCYAGVMRRFGFWEMQSHSYLEETTYNGNRYALTLFSSIGDLFGPLSGAVYPFLATVLWVIAIWLVVRLAFRWFRWSVGRLETLLITEAFVFSTLYQAPDLSQILYWRTGMLTYLAPLVTGTFLLALILWQVLGERFSPLALGGIFLLAFVGAGFSETGAALQMGGLLFLTASICLIYGLRHSLAHRTLKMVGIALLGIVAGMVLLFVSPSNQARLDQLPPRPALIELIKMSLFYTRVFFSVTRKTLALSVLADFVIFFALSLGIFTRQPRALSYTARQYFVAFTLLLLAIVGLVTCCMAPVAYVQVSYPGGRTLITARYIAVLGTALVGWWTGMVITQLGGYLKGSQRIPQAAAAILVGLSVVYPLLGNTTVYADTAKFRKWASFWDARDQQIHQAFQQDIREVDVVFLDRVIHDVAELQHSENFWYNNCAEWYYDMFAIRANQPGWDR